MKNWFRNIGLLIMLLLAGRMAAQMPVLDSVCSGAVRHYGVDGDAGSTYSWILTPPAVLLPSDADTLEMTWNFPAGTYVLDVVQHGLNGCDADTVSGLILIFEAPDVYAGPDDMVCIGRYYKLVDATESYTTSLLWATSGDGTFDNNTWLNPTYTPGPNDEISGLVTLTLTGYGAVADEDACAPSVWSMQLAVVFEIVPQFNPIGPLCQYQAAPILPDTDLNGMTGTWTPPVISTDVLGDFDYTFSPNDPAQCGIDTTITITITDEIDPQFEPIPPLCINIVPPALPDTSLEGITGTWEPPVISTDVPGIFNFVFTPNDSTQCGLETNMYIAVVTELGPEFEPIGPLCQDDTPPALPGVSINGISGTWAPPTIDTSVPGIFTYYFTADPDACGTDTTMDITILELVDPQFEPIGPLCQYQAAPILPDTSLEGITGTWNPAWINTSTPGIFTYTFNPNDPSQCGLVTSIQIIIVPETTPQFNPIGPLCINITPPALPDTSLNGIPGTWEPPVISTDVPGTFFFVFTPIDTIPCVLDTTLAVTVINEFIPQFEPIGPLCQDIVPPALPDTSLEGISGTWVPPTIDTGTPGTFIYTFTPDTGQCAVAAMIGITIATEIIPVFDTIGPLCQNISPPALPGVSLNNITGTWVPPTIDTSVPGTFIYTFTPDNQAQCGVETEIAIDIVTEINPEFDQIEPLCQGIVPPVLPGISGNNITGTWEPPVIDTSVPGIFAFTFTPDNQEQCGTEYIMYITIATEINPVFNQIGPLCQNSEPPDLPDVSLNNIHGSWDPLNISTADVGTFTYTFTTDDPEQCGTDTIMEITIVPAFVPVFDPIGTLCQYSPPILLPDTSLNNIPGTWDPPMVSTNVPGTFNYTFTPEDEECTNEVIITVLVIPEVMPVFDPIGPLSQNSTAPALPDSSLNGIYGTWVPPFIDTSVPGTFTYVFTPDEDQCASQTDMEITVLFDYLDAITGAGGHCVTGGFIVPLEVDHFTSVATFQLKLSYNTDKLLCTGFSNIHPQLDANLSGVNDQAGGIITINWQDNAELTLIGQQTVCELMFTPKEPGQGELTWYTGPTQSYFTNLDGMQIPALFFAEEVEIYEPPSILLADTKTVCVGDTVNIYGVATSTYPPLIYLWTNPDGSTQATSPFLAGVTEADAGYYTLLVTDSLGCTDQKSIRLVVSENPVADFHGSDTLTVPPGYILAAGTGQASYLWNTGETTESITIDTTGWYWVELVTHVECKGTDSIFIVVTELPKDCLFIPNAFTPNNDGLNDTFKVVARCPLSTFTMTIFNQWGQELFETYDITEGWDGKYKGTLCPNDAYVYRIVFKDAEAPAEERHQIISGMVLILK